jgi:hypothetical protein
LKETFVFNTDCVSEDCYYVFGDFDYTIARDDAFESLVDFFVEH